MIELTKICITSGAFRLDEVDLSVARGEYVALMGRTGQGKSTILEAICGLRKVRSGRVIIGGVDVTHLPPSRRGIGYVPQDLALFPTMTVRQHLEFAPRLRGWPSQRLAQRTGELADWLGISKLLDRSVRTLSGGEAQRTALGRALSFEPQVLLLDEPMSALDDATRTELHQVIKTIRQRTAVTTLHITHNLAEAQLLADRVLRLEAGRIQS